MKRSESGSSGGQASETYDTSVHSAQALATSTPIPSLGPAGGATVVATILNTPTNNKSTIEVTKEPGTSESPAIKYVYERRPTIQLEVSKIFYIWNAFFVLNLKITQIEICKIN